jgi:glutamate/tyrosine decarboxylase-like PLP-dependent enzyme
MPAGTTSWLEGERGSAPIEKEHLMQDRYKALELAHRHAAAYLDSLGERSVWPRASYDEIYQSFHQPLPAEGIEPGQVVDDLVRLAEPGINAMSSGRFYGFVVGGTLPAALAADWMTAAWDQNAGMTQVTPAAAAAEAVAGEWLLDLLGLPGDSAVGFVTGAMMANFTCLAAARRAVLDAAGWDLRAKGLRDAPRIRFVVGEFRHHTIDRSADLLGFGRDDTLVVPCDDQGRMLPGELDRLLDEADGRLIVCLQAGEVHTGAFDAFEELIPIARRHGAWIHVDGAFGLWAAASTRTRHLTAGVTLADSWATDGHKTLNVPYDTGFAIVRDPAAMRAVLAVSADYLLDSTGDPLERTPEFSRRARGFPVWAALRSLGRDGVDALVSGLAERASQMADGLRTMPGVEVLNDVVFTQVLATFGDDDATRRLGERLLDDGAAALTPGVWAGRAVQRCSLSGWATTADDVDTTLNAIRRLLDH